MVASCRCFPHHATQRTTRNSFAVALSAALTHENGNKTMTEHEFTLILKVGDLADEQCNALFEAGCDDGTISTSQGVTRIDFCREAPTLEEALRSAIANVHVADIQVERVEIEADHLVKH